MLKNELTATVRRKYPPQLPVGQLRLQGKYSRRRQIGRECLRRSANRRQHSRHFLRVLSQMGFNGRIDGAAAQFCRHTAKRI